MHHMARERAHNRAVEHREAGIEPWCANASEPVALSNGIAERARRRRRTDGEKGSGEAEMSAQHEDLANVQALSRNHE